MDWLSTGLDYLYDESMGAFLDPRQRVFWPCLLTSAALAVLTLLVARRGRPGKARFVARFLFDRRVWLHPSSRLDYQLLFANALVRLVLVAPLGLSAFALAAWSVAFLDRHLGAPAPSSWSSGAVTAVYTVTLFLAWDFSRYLLHRLAHQVPLLWEIHKVHHSAEVMTPFTLFRVHPVERFLFGLRGVLVTGIVTGVFFYLFRERAVQLELLGVNAAGFVFNAVGSNLRHSHVWLSYGRLLEHLFISPAQHQIHHSTRREHYDSNYGTWLAIWDWLGGSLYVTTPRRELVRFGLEREDLNHDPHGLLSSILEPMATAPAQLRSPPRSDAPRSDAPAP